MKLRDRLSDPELEQLQAVMLGEPLPVTKVKDPSALVELLGKGLVYQAHGFYWPAWDVISKSSA
jgi:hypothetical protein